MSPNFIYSGFGNIKANNKYIQNTMLPVTIAPTINRSLTKDTLRFNHSAIPPQTPNSVLFFDLVRYCIT